MSSIVTFEQAKKLKGMGFNTEVHRYFLYERLISSDDFDYNGINKIHCSAPSVYEALDFIREEKGIPCSVHLEFEENNKGWFYYGEYGIKGDNRVYDTETFDTHPLAESALLDAVLTYLEKK